ncbi:hypothetical protein [Microcystis phage MJing1]|nr:hypothetical protein [Microcystis phage MJing1]
MIRDLACFALAGLIIAALHQSDAPNLALLMLTLYCAAIGAWVGALVARWYGGP